MPILKVYVDKPVYEARKTELAAALAPIQKMFVDTLEVPVEACHLAVLPVLGLPGQMQLNAEFLYLAVEGRDRPVLTAACEKLRDILVKAAGVPCITRALPLDPAIYVAVK